MKFGASRYSLSALVANRTTGQAQLRLVCPEALVGDQAPVRQVKSQPTATISRAMRTGPLQRVRPFTAETRVRFP